jgi:type VI secretion system secreted protein VgrG
MPARPTASPKVPQGPAPRAIASAELVGDFAQALKLERMVAREELSKPFELVLDCLSDIEAQPVKAADALGKSVTLRLALPEAKAAGEGWRWWNGHCARFEYLGMTPLRKYHRQRVVLRPWLWFLTLSSDCRIFQDRTVPEILKSVFEEYGFSSQVEYTLTHDHPKRDYCVQYRETDFAFVSRLMEQEGIYYWHRHAFDGKKGQHTLVLADALAAHKSAPGYERVGFRSSARRPGAEDEYIDEWRTAHELVPQSCALGDFDYEDPSVKLEASRGAAGPAVGPLPGAKLLELYDYPGGFGKKPVPEPNAGSSGKSPPKWAGDAAAQLRMEEQESRRERVFATMSARGLEVGRVFELCDHPRADQNGKYLIVATDQRVLGVAYDADPAPDATGEPFYRGELTAMRGDLQYRPPRSTPHPVVEGPQTAIVVGNPNAQDERVHTEGLGRIKVRFHWDRQEKEGDQPIPDERRSCWLRVSQDWAGQKWGSLHLPHVGQEVVVSFLEGDPDRPLVTGRVYNAVQTPPLDLPKQNLRTVVAKDYRGNYIVMDATPGDEDVEVKTVGRHFELKKESEASLTLGNKCEIAMGAVFDGFAGWKAEAALATSFELKGGPSFSLTWGQKAEKSFGNVEHVIDEDWIVDCAQTTCICSGKFVAGRDQKQARNSIYYATEGLTELSVGEEIREVGKPPWWKDLWPAALALVAAGAQAGALEGTTKDGERTTLGEALGGTLGGLIGMVPFVKNAYEQIKDSTQPKKHDKKTAWLALSDQGDPAAPPKALLDSTSDVEIGTTQAKKLTLGRAEAETADLKAKALTVGADADSAVSLGNDTGATALKGKTLDIGVTGTTTLNLGNAGSQLKLKGTSFDLAGSGTVEMNGAKIMIG